MPIDREEKFTIPLDEVAINGKWKDGWTVADEKRAVEISFEEEPEEEIEEEDEEEDDELGLTIRQYDLYEMFEALAEHYGKFTQGVGPDGCDYQQNSPNAKRGISCAQCVFYSGSGKCEIVDGKVSPMGLCRYWIISEQNIGDEEEVVQEEMEDEDEERAISLAPPEFMRSAARRGLKLHKEGYGGDGLVAQTIEDANKMAGGQVSEQKWRKIGPWIARHMVDLDAPKNKNTNDPGYPGAGLVAHLLWGSGPSKSSAERAMNYAIRLVERLDKEREDRAASEPAPPKDQIKGSDENPKGSAEGKMGGIDLDASTEKALETKASEHNKKMRDGDRPVWTTVRLGALKAVWRRGAGAYSTSHRPGVSRAAWAMARVNAFLTLARTGRPENPKYVTDNDLLHPEHPKYSKE